MGRRRPNVLITGTPGTGKTTLAAEIVDRLLQNNDGDLSMAQHVNVGEVAQQQKCYEGHDAELDTQILDEDKLLDYLEGVFEKAEEEKVSCIADFHVCEIFPERWFDLVLVLRTRTEVLFDRLQERGYNERKRQNNMESEIMQIILEEAREAYDPEIVHEVPSNDLQDMESNTQRVLDWIEQWMSDHALDDDDDN
jgi:adenylate kinase